MSNSEQGAAMMEGARMRGASGSTASGDRDSYLTNAQRAWLASNGRIGWLPIIKRIYGKLDVSSLRFAYRQVLKRHEMLRMAFIVRDDRTVERSLLAIDQFDMALIDLSHLDPDSAEEFIWNEQSPAFSGNGSLQRGSISLTLYRISQDEHALVGAVHHVCFDATSYALFSKELIRAYGWRITGYDGAPQGKSYAEFADWEHAWVGADKEAAATKVWDAALRNALPLDIAGCGARSTSPKVESYVFQVPDWIFNDIKPWAQRHGFSVSMVMHLAFAVVFARWNKGQSPALGTICRGRPREFEEVIGAFIQVKPFFVDLSDNPTAEVALQRARRNLLDVLDLRKPVTSSVTERLQLNRAMINYHNQHDAEMVPVNPDKKPPPKSNDPEDPYSTKRWRPKSPSILGVHFIDRPLRKRLNTRFTGDIAINVWQKKKVLLGEIAFAVDRVRKIDTIALLANVNKFLEWLPNNLSRGVSEFNVVGFNEPQQDPAAVA